jgi:ribonuclease E
MPNKMLIDAAHPEETRVVVLRGQRVEEFDFESATRKQLRGNIYLAKVTRVEPSLQAAFIDYGGNRHGFLAFSEIHPDYYQIPVADRQALIAEDERAQRAADAEADQRAGRRHGGRERGSERRRDESRKELIDPEFDTCAMAAASEAVAPPAGSVETAPQEAGPPMEIAAEPLAPENKEDLPAVPAEGGTPIDLSELESSSAAEPIPTADEAPLPEEGSPPAVTGLDAVAGDGEVGRVEPVVADNITEVSDNEVDGEEEIVESVGGADALEEVPERMPRLRRQYKIQEVIKRRQVMLVQVVKEERGTKGAALTTYLSLAGRYSVLMPNTARGGGISRKITSADDRRRLKDIAQELEVPEGMGVILRTAGASRTKTEVKRDFEYLLRLWETVRDLTLKSTAPKLVYEEGSLVKRSIRDLYSKDIDEILVAGEDAFKEAKDFMRMLMPSHVRNVKLYRDSLPIFTRNGIESQLDAMFTPVMQLRSGGYIVLNQAEALVAIDVNSGRATREHHIEDTALKTNLEAADEIARQLRLRDLAGLIVIDFIDMDEKRNNRAVERRLKECLRHDRARIQVGHISHFGLLEMSRQRIRSSVLESSTEKCPQCGGSGHVRSVASVALQLLRSLEEMLLKGATHNLTVRTRSDIALYLLNHKRAHLRALEERFRIAIMINADANIGGQLSFVIERGEQVHSIEQAKALALAPASAIPIETDTEDEEDGEEAEDDEFEDDDAPPSELIAAEAGAHLDGERGQSRKRRRRRRGRRGSEDREVGTPARDRDGGRSQPPSFAALAAPSSDQEEEDETQEPNGAAATDLVNGTNGDGERRRRRRGRRGGRRNRRAREDEAAPLGAERESETPFAPDDSDAAETEFAGAITDIEAEPAAEMRPPLASFPDSDSSSDEAEQHEAPPHEPPAATAEQPPREETAVEEIAPAALPQPSLPATPRRRSTVREPAPMVARDEGAAPAASLIPQPSAEPVVSSSVEPESSDRPRRSGWWSRRALGKG